MATASSELPADPARDGFLDVVRVLAIARVVAWHAYGAAWLSWAFSAMPAMFFVAGSLLARALDKADAAGAPATTVLLARLRRLLVPLGAFAVVAHGIMLWAHQQNPGPETAIDPAGVLWWFVPLVDPTGSAWEHGWLSRPLWYLRCLLWLLLLAPVLLRLVRNHPARTAGTAVVLVGAAEVVGRGDPGEPLLQLTDLVVYGPFFLLGVAHRDRRFAAVGPRRLLAAAAVLGAGAAAWALTQPVPGGVANNSPAAATLVGLTWLSLLLALADPLRRLARNARAARVIVTVNRRALTIYLWHTAVIAGAALLLQGTPLHDGAPRNAALAVLVPAGLVLACAMFGWVEDLAANGRVRSLRPERVAGALAAAVVVAGIASGTAASAAKRGPLTIPAPSARPADRQYSADPLPPVAVRPLDAGLAPATGSTTRRLVEDFLRDHGIRAAVVAVQRPGAAPWLDLVGDGEGAAPDATFGIGSITKPLIATVAMQLVDEGLLTLDGPLPAPRGIERWWPSLTLRRLLDHSSGLRPYHNVQGFDPERLHTVEELVQSSLDAPPDFTPGTARGYSNSGYLALGLVLEHVTKEPLGALLHDRVFEPLGMGASYLERGAAPGWVGYAAGGVWSTAADLTRFAVGRWGAGAALVTRQDAAMAPDADGFGLGIVAYCPCSAGPTGARSNAFGHDGGASTLQWFPRHQVAVALVLSESMYAGRGFAPEDVHELVARIADAAVRP